MSESFDRILSELNDLEGAFKNDSKEVTQPESLEDIRIKYLGRKGSVAGYFKKMNAVSSEDKPKLGNALNKLKEDFQAEIARIQASLKTESEVDGFVDLTLPGTPPQVGYRNPLMLVMDEVKEIFSSMGFGIETGPLVETEFYHFEALNAPADHPSRDLQDTFFLENDLLLRAHTSPVQIRTMQKQQPPVRIIAPGRCARKDTPDANHLPEFHQCEGLVVDKGIAFSHLKGTLLAFARKLFGPNIQVRFRPSFFPFTEPSAEFDFSCVICSGKGCRTCKKTGWLEISGAGMVDPNVFGYVDYDPETYSGFAWGMGIERIAMMKYGIDDIRHFYDNDLRFLNQF